MASRRAFGLAATVILHLALILTAITTWTSQAPIPQQRRLSVFDIAAPDPAPENQPTPPRPSIVLPVTSPSAVPVESVVADPSPVPVIIAPAVMIDAPPPPAAPARPVPPPAPPPPKAGNVDATWESRLLAHIDRYKRYPKTMGRRPQGTALVRFTMNRRGDLLSVGIEKSAGNDALDKAAVDTIRRAAPLPAIPADRPPEVQLTVPVEFLYD